MILVYAGSYHEYRNFLDDLRLPYTSHIYHYVDRVESALSAEYGTPFILYGSWAYRSRRHRAYFFEVVKRKHLLEFKLAHERDR